MQWIGTTNLDQSPEEIAEEPIKGFKDHDDELDDLGLDFGDEVNSDNDD